jgi:anaerobic selenocysteine-containing dehydrogenase
MMPEEQHLSVCRCCGALCGVIVSVRGDQVVAVRGDPDHPNSHGYICPKGRSLPAFHHHPSRLDRPRLGSDDTTWDCVLDDLAARIAELRATRGPDSIGAYTSTGQYFDTAAVYAENGFLAALGTHQLYTAATVDCAPTWRAAELVTGFAKPFHPVWRPEDDEPSLVILIGFNPVVSHVYFGAQLPDPVRRIRQFRARGGELWVLDPRRTETAALADRHLGLRPNTDVYVLAWLIRELLVDGADLDELRDACTPEDVAALRSAVSPFDLVLVAAQSGVREEDLLSLLHAIRSHRRLAVISGTGVNFARTGLLSEWLRWALLIVTGSLDRPGGMRFNPGETVALEHLTWSHHAPPAGATDPGPASRPDLNGWLGEYPCVALVDEIEAGHVAGLFVAGGSPLTAFPDPDRTRAALASLSFLAVVDVIDNELTAMATHVLPVAGQLERGDLLRSYIPAVVAPAGDRRPAWWVFSELGRRLGMDALGGMEVNNANGEAIVRRIASGCRDGADALLEAGPRGLQAPRLYGWVHERVLPKGKWRLAPRILIERLPALLEPETPSLLLVSHRVMHSHNSVPYSEPPQRQSVPVVDVSPDDATSWHVEEGDCVRVTSHSGALEGTAHIDRRLAVGSIAVNHGWIHTNVARLIDGVNDIDPLTGQPAQTGVPVTLERLGDP